MQINWLISVGTAFLPVISIPFLELCRYALNVERWQIEQMFELFIFLHSYAVSCSEIRIIAILWMGRNWISFTVLYWTRAVGTIWSIQWNPHICCNSDALNNIIITYYFSFIRLHSTNVRFQVNEQIFKSRLTNERERLKKEMYEEEKITLKERKTTQNTYFCLSIVSRPSIANGIGKEKTNQILFRLLSDYFIWIIIVNFANVYIHKKRTEK